MSQIRSMLSLSSSLSILQQSSAYRVYSKRCMIAFGGAPKQYDQKRRQQQQNLHHHDRSSIIAHVKRHYHHSVIQSNMTLNNNDDPTVSKLDSSMMAADYFGNIYFYNEDEFLANYHSNDRKKIFQNKTVKELLEPIQTLEELNDMLSGTGIDPSRVTPIWEQVKNERTPEDILNGKIVHHGGGEELELIKNKFVKLDSFKILTDKNAGIEDREDDRQDDIRFVLGPSGSGKTFFSVKVAATDGDIQLSKYVIVYVKLTQVDSANLRDSANVIDAKRIVKFVYKLLEDTCEGAVIRQPLNLHLSLILDEAGLNFDNYFDSSEKMTTLYTELKTVSTTVRLVLCGTGLTGINFGSDGQAKKYRMKAWTMEDFSKVNEQRFKLGIAALETIQYHPQLKALITNARSAGYLLQAVKVFIKVDEKTWSLENGLNDRIRQQIFDFAPAIVQNVVSLYVLSNGIKDLKETEQRRVAAYIFDTIEKTRNKEIIIPEFNDLQIKERSVALSLITSIVEQYSNGDKIIVETEERSISITPAITIILFWMCGVSIKIISDWKIQQVISALYKFRRHLRCLVGNRCRDGDDLFEKELMLLRIVELQKRVPEPKATKMFFIPYVDKWTIWVNRDLAPFADVVAPYTFYRSKYSQIRSRTINLIDELEKCGLIMDSEENRNCIGWIVTKSLEQTWKSRIERKRSRTDLSLSYSSNVTKSKFFYPDMQLSGPLLNPIEDYAIVEKIGNDWILIDPNGGEYTVDITQDLSKELVFIVACNQNQIILSRNEKIQENKTTSRTMTVSCDYLDDDGNVKDDIPDLDREEWNHYKSLLRPNVRIQFLLS